MAKRLPPPIAKRYGFMPSGFLKIAKIKVKSMTLREELLKSVSNLNCADLYLFSFLKVHYILRRPQKYDKISKHY